MRRCVCTCVRATNRAINSLHAINLNPSSPLTRAPTGLALVVDLLALYSTSATSPSEPEARKLALLSLDLLARAFALTSSSSSSSSGSAPLLRRNELCRALARQGLFPPLAAVFGRVFDRCV